jgi:hypothetical protein
MYLPPSGIPVFLNDESEEAQLDLFTGVSAG